MDEIEEGLWLGDLADAKNHGGDFNYVISLCEETTEHTTTHVPIVTGGVSAVSMFEYEDAWKHVRNTMADRSADERLLVHCEEGRSRGPSVIVLYLCMSRGIRPCEALQLVVEKHPYTNPKAENFNQIGHCLYANRKEKGAGIKEYVS